MYAKSKLVRYSEIFHLESIGKSWNLSVAPSIDRASVSKNLYVLVAGGILIAVRGARVL